MKRMRLKAAYVNDAINYHRDAALLVTSAALAGASITTDDAVDAWIAARPNGPYSMLTVPLAQLWAEVQEFFEEAV